MSVRTEPQPPAITVVIATRNRPESLRRTLADLRVQDTGGPLFDIVVVDDGSQPPLEFPSNTDPPGQRILRTPGVERSAARNAGARVARGATILFMDDDLAIGPGFVRAHLNAHRAWPGALVVGSVLLPSARSQGSFVSFRQRLELTQVPAEAGPVHSRNFCTAQNMSISAMRFRALGGFRSDVVSGEDQELALRHTADGGVLAYEPTARAIHLDEALDIRSYCRRTEWGGRHLAGFIEAQPDWPDNEHRLLVCGPTRWLREPLHLSLAKTSRTALAWTIPREMLFLLTGFLERTGSRFACEAAYRLLLGIHLQKGLRSGLLDRELHPISPGPAQAE